MPDLTNQIMQVYTRFNEVALRELTVKCFAEFLGKGAHNLYTKEFLEKAASGLLKAIQADTVNEQELKFMIQVMDSLSESKQFKPGISPSS